MQQKGLTLFEQKTFDSKNQRPINRKIKRIFLRKEDILSKNNNERLDLDIEIMKQTLNNQQKLGVNQSCILIHSTFDKRGNTDNVLSKMNTIDQGTPESKTMKKRVNSQIHMKMRNLSMHDKSLQIPSTNDTLSQNKSLIK